MTQPPENQKSPPPEPLKQPVPLQYRNPMQPYVGPRRNSVGKFFLRMFAGITMGGGSIFIGFVLSSRVDQSSGLSVVVFFAPFASVLTLMIILTIRRKKFGYITGILLAPFILAAAIFVLLLIICGGWGRP